MNKAEGEMVLDEKGLEAAQDAYDEEAAQNHGLHQHRPSCLEAAIQTYLSASRAATESDGWQLLKAAKKIVERFDFPVGVTSIVEKEDIEALRIAIKQYELPSPPGTHPGKDDNLILTPSDMARALENITQQGDDVVEKVARALCKEAAINPDEEYEEGYFGWHDYVAEAKAAIQAMGK